MDTSTVSGDTQSVLCCGCGRQCAAGGLSGVTAGGRRLWWTVGHCSVCNGFNDRMKGGSEKSGTWKYFEQHILNGVK